jgi:hypothetical protein
MVHGEKNPRMVHGGKKVHGEKKFGLNISTTKSVLGQTIAQSFSPFSARDG